MKFEGISVAENGVRKKIRVRVCGGDITKNGKKSGGGKSRDFEKKLPLKAQIFVKKVLGVSEKNFWYFFVQNFLF